MKKIAIVSEYFAPQNEIASIRITKIAKYLNKTGNYQITVITRKKENVMIDGILKKDAESISDYIEIEDGKTTQWLLNFLDGSPKKKFPSKDMLTKEKLIENNSKDSKYWEECKKEWISLKRYLRVLLFNYLYYLDAIKILEKEKRDFDVIFSSYGPTSSHFIGRYLKEKNPHSYWIADFRDPVLSDHTPKIFRFRDRRFASSVCKKADVITPVSPGMIEQLHLRKGTKIEWISNGYDSDDMETFCTEKNYKPFLESPKSKMRMAYLGSLYSGKRDLRPIFKAIKELILEKKINSDNIELIYAGPSKEVFAQQISQYGLTENALIFDKIEREKSISIQLESDILLLASWNETGYIGVMTGKLYENLMIKKPILCTISGNLPHSDLKEFIEKGQLGFCYEEASGEIPFAELKQYIYEQYLEYTKNGCLRLDRNEQFISQFHHKNIVQKIISLIEK